MTSYRPSLFPPTYSSSPPLPSLFKTVSLDGLAHQLEIIRMSCIILSSWMQYHQGAGSSLKKQNSLLPSLYIPTGGLIELHHCVLLLKNSVQDHAKASSNSQTADDFTCCFVETSHVSCYFNLPKSAQTLRHIALYYALSV